MRPSLSSSGSGSGEAKGDNPTIDEKDVKLGAISPAGCDANHATARRMCEKGVI